MLAELHGALKRLVPSADLHWNRSSWLSKVTAGQFPERAAGLAHHPEVLSIMELLHEGVMVIDVAGSVVYANPALKQIVDADPEATKLRTECLALAQHLFSMARQARELPGSTDRRLRTTAAGYWIRGALVEPRFFDSQPISLVVLVRTTPEKIPLEALQSRYGLTPREALVALQLAEGRTNDEIAQRLGISLNTVRRHVERVLPKLDVHSRAAVAAKLTADS